MSFMYLIFKILLLKDTKPIYRSIFGAKQKILPKGCPEIFVQNNDPYLSLMENVFDLFTLMRLPKIKYKGSRWHLLHKGNKIGKVVYFSCIFWVLLGNSIGIEYIVVVNRECWRKFHPRSLFVPRLYKFYLTPDKINKNLKFVGSIYLTRMHI